jgi:transcriptional regulator with XRE-family HTH domain
MTDKEFLKYVGLKLKCQRIMTELSIKEVSEKCGLSYSSINSIEHGKTDFHILNLKRLASIYSIELSTLLE